MPNNVQGSWFTGTSFDWRSDNRQVTPTSDRNLMTVGNGDVVITDSNGDVRVRFGNIGSHSHAPSSDSGNRSLREMLRYVGVDLEQRELSDTERLLNRFHEPERCEFCGSHKPNRHTLCQNELCEMSENILMQSILSSNIVESNLSDMIVSQNTLVDTQQIVSNIQRTPIIGSVGDFPWAEPW